MDDAVVATAAAIAVSCSFPCFLYAAWIVIDAEVVTWSVLTRHLRYIAAGLVLTTGPAVVWMVPRLFDNLGGATAVHAFVGLQAYAMLALALTGIVPIFRAKYGHDLYHDPEADVPLEAIDPERMSAWRTRLRVGVVGFVLLWLVAYALGVGRYVATYL